MHILFLTDNFPPEVNAPATRSFDHINEWIKDEDVKITVITCFPNFPKGKIFKGYKQKLYSVEYFNGIRVIRVLTYIAKNKGLYKRVLDYLSFSIMSFIVGCFLNFDIIVATSPQFFTTWTGCLLSKVKKVSWVFELRDLWPESILALNAINNKFLIKFLEKIELFLYKDSKKIISLTNSFKHDLISRGIESEKIVTIPNGVNLDFFNNKKRIIIEDEIQKVIQNKFVVGYFGTHGISHGLEFIIKSIPKIKPKNIFFLFIGDGSEKEKLEDLAKNISIKNILFLENVSKEKILKYYKFIDVSLVCLRNKLAFKKVIPSKIFEACALRKPILLGVDGEAKDILENYQAGLSFKPENFNDFERNLISLMDKEIYNKCKIGCSKLAKSFSRKKLAKKMLEELKKTYIS